MKKYIRVYLSLIRLNFASLVVYRANFMNNVIGSTIWGVFSLVSIVLLMSRTTSLFGWSRNEILLFSGVYSLFIGIFHLFFSRNFERLSSIIRLGLLDTMLVKPIDSQFLVSLSIVNFTSVIRILLGTLFVAYILGISHIQVTLLTILLFLVGLFIGLGLLYSFWFITTTCIIWFPDLSNLIEFLYSYSNVGRYPREMYRHLQPVLFALVLPLTFFIIAPTKILLAKITPYDVYGLVGFSLGFFYISRVFWKFALRFYTSVSS